MRSPSTRKMSPPKSSNGRTDRYLLLIVEYYYDGKIVQKRRVASYGIIDDNSDNEIRRSFTPSSLSHKTVPTLVQRLFIPFIPNNSAALGGTEFACDTTGATYHARCLS